MRRGRPGVERGRHVADPPIGVGPNGLVTSGERVERGVADRPLAGTGAPQEPVVGELLEGATPAVPRRWSSCLIAPAMALDLYPIGSSRAPSLCLCTGRNASDQVALPWVVAKRAPRGDRLRTPAFTRERGAECRRRIPHWDRRRRRAATLPSSTPRRSAAGARR